MISDVNAYKDYLMMVNATPVLVKMVREFQMVNKITVIIHIFILPGHGA